MNPSAPLLPPLRRAAPRLGWIGLALGLAAAFAPRSWAQDAGGAVGLFTAHGDIGVASVPGKSAFDPAEKTYTITGSGANMWVREDDFQFAWKKMSGDVSLTADIAFQPSALAHPNPHRKACLMIRQSLDADSPYVDAALHGNGLAALQFREVKGGITYTVHSNVIGPVRMRLEKRGDVLTLFLAQAAGKDPQYSGASIRLGISGPYYLGLGVCAHNENNTSTNQETAVFSRVEVKTGFPRTKPRLYSAIETQVASFSGAGPIQGADRAILYVAPGRIEGPVWLPDNSAVVFSREGLLFRLPIRLPVIVPGAPMHALVLGAAPTAAGDPEGIDTGSLTHVGREHGVSPDGTEILFVDHPGGQPANTYLVSLAGGTPVRLTPDSGGGGSTLSPDGRTLAFSSGGDIFTTPVDGSAAPTRLTRNAGKNYGPQFSHDGRSIVFCSDRSGLMQIWRMKADGTGLEQLTADAHNNWFPHYSPDDGAILFISYPPEVKTDAADAAILIRSVDRSGRISLLDRVPGGPGSAPTWSPDLQHPQLTFATSQWVD